MNVLVGVRETEASFAAVERAIDRARQAEDEVTVAVMGSSSDEPTAAGVRQRVRSLVSESDVRTEIKNVDGDPGARIVELAESNGYDQLVIGDRSRTPMGKLQLDAVTQFVLFNSHVTVKLVRETPS